MAIHLFDQDRQELTLVDGKTLVVAPLHRSRWPVDDARLSSVVLRWACLHGHADVGDEVAVLAGENAPEPV